MEKYEKIAMSIYNEETQNKTHYKFLCFNEKEVDKITFIPAQKRGQAIYISDGENSQFFCSVNDRFDGEKVHGNTINKAIETYCNMFNFKDFIVEIETLYNKNKAIFDYNQEHKADLENLCNDLKFLEKYLVRKTSFDKIEVERYGDERLQIELKLYNNGYTHYIYRIILDNENGGFLICDPNYKWEHKTYKEIVDFFKKREQEEYKPTLQAKQEKAAREERERQNKIERHNKLYKILAQAQQENKEILFNSKSSYFVYDWRGNKYSVGTGKTGKYYRCDSDKLIQLIDKGQLSYLLFDNKQKPCRLYNTKELKALQYEAI